MAPTRVRFIVVTLVSLVLTRTALADPVSAAVPRLRTFEPRLRALVARGMRESPTFRALAARLERSDVIVLLLTDLCGPSQIAGRLTFLSAAGGFRYVAVRLRPLGTIQREVAVLAHELQHAVEIAERPGIVDEQALAREYRRIGHRNESVPQGVAFDTRAAIDVGHQVHRELADAAEVRVFAVR